MADPVVFNPATETLADFNKRIGTFCQDPETPVVNVVPSLSRASLVLSLASPEDFPVPLIQVLQPLVFTITAEQHANLEQTLTGFRDEAVAWLGEDRPISHVQVFDIATEHASKHPFVAYALLIGIIGQLEDDTDLDPAGVSVEGE